jgi:hypothetical protein
MEKKEEEKTLEEFMAALSSFLRQPAGTFLRLNQAEGEKLYELLKELGDIPDESHRA